jgi:hypothetical protein
MGGESVEQLRFGFWLTKEHDTLQPPRSFDASESKAAGLHPGDMKRRIG